MSSFTHRRSPGVARPTLLRRSSRSCVNGIAFGIDGGAVGGLL